MTNTARKPAGMRPLPCGCRYKVITIEPLGLSLKPGCNDGYTARKAGEPASRAHVGQQIRVRQQQEASGA